MSARRTVVRWEELRDRLGRVTAGAPTTPLRSPAEVRSLLDERARRYAAPPPAAASPEECPALLGFVVGGERYGVEIRHVREVIATGEVTPLPETHPWVLGLINLRGDLLPVIDLRMLLGLPGADAVESYVVVLGGERAAIGVQTDGMPVVATVAGTDLLEPAAGEGSARAYLRGVTGDALTVLDGGRLLRELALFPEETDEWGGMPRRRGDA